MRFKQYLKETRSKMKKNFDIPKGVKVDKVYIDSDIVYAVSKGKTYNIDTVKGYKIESWFQNNEKIVATLKKIKQ